MINGSAALLRVYGRAMGDKRRKSEYQALRKKPQPEAAGTPTDQTFFPKFTLVVVYEIDLIRVWACKGYHKNQSKRGCTEISVTSALLATLHLACIPGSDTG